LKILIKIIGYYYHHFTGSATGDSFPSLSK
jgi:hypothetical protein